MDENSVEIKQLLREIRDLQKAHFERYVAFTEQVLQSQSRAEKENARAQAEHEAWQQGQSAYQEEMRDLVRATQRQSNVGMFLVLGFLVFLAGSYVIANVVLSGAAVAP